MFQVPSGRMEGLPQMEHCVETIIDLVPEINAIAAQIFS